MAATLARKPTAGWERWGSRSRSVSGQCQTRHRGTLPGQHQGHTAGSYAEACSAGRAVTTAGPAAGRSVGVPPCRRADIPRRWPVQKPEARTSQHQPPPHFCCGLTPPLCVCARGRVLRWPGGTAEPQSSPLATAGPRRSGRAPAGRIGALCKSGQGAPSSGSRTPHPPLAPGPSTSVSTPISQPTVFFLPLLWAHFSKTVSNTFPHRIPGHSVGPPSPPSPPVRRAVRRKRGSWETQHREPEQQLGVPKSPG